MLSGISVLPSSLSARSLLSRQSFWQLRSASLLPPGSVASTTPFVSMIAALSCHWNSTLGQAVLTSLSVCVPSWSLSWQNAVVWNAVVWFKALAAGCCVGSAQNVMACSSGHAVRNLERSVKKERWYFIVELKVAVCRTGTGAAAHRQEAAAWAGSCPAAAGGCPAGPGRTTHLSRSRAAPCGSARFCLAVGEIFRLAGQVSVHRLRPHSPGLISTPMHGVISDDGTGKKRSFQGAMCNGNQCGRPASACQHSCGMTVYR